MTYGDDNQDAMILYEAMNSEYSLNREATRQYKQRGALLCDGQSRQEGCSV